MSNWSRLDAVLFSFLGMGIMNTVSSALIFHYIAEASGITLLVAGLVQIGLFFIIAMYDM